jgi:hypothetical protein
LLAATALLPFPGTTFAETEPPPSAHTELWTGAQIFDRVWSLYTGGAFAPFGTLAEDGFRVRAVAGYGDYRSGTVSFADLLLGYHKQVGSLTIKFLAGLTVADHTARDPFSDLDGPGVGGKAVLETWWNATDRIWLSTDLSYGSLHSSYSTRARLGWRIWPELSLGFEGGAAGSLDTDIARAGAFLRYEWATGEVSVSSGMAFESFGGDWDGSRGGFATFSALTRF